MPPVQTRQVEIENPTENTISMEEINAIVNDIK
jgi:hypothetical protein